MKISCEIIRDLLPLYAEGMASNATKEMVEEHISACEDCANELEKFRKPAKVSAEIAADSLKRVGDSIRRRRILAVMTVLLFIATVLIGGALMLDAKIYLSAGEAVEDIYVDGDAVKIHWCDGITGTSASVDTETYDNYAVTAWTTLYNRLFPAEKIPYDLLDAEVKALVSKEQYEMLDGASRFSLKNGGGETNFVYVDPKDNSMTLVLNQNQPLPDGPAMEVNHDIGYYCIGLAFAGVLCCLLSKLFRAHWYGELAGRISILIGSLAVSAVIVTAGQFAGLPGDFQEAVVDSTAVAVPMTLCGLCLRQLIKLNRQDRGIQ